MGFTWDMARTILMGYTYGLARTIVLGFTKRMARIFSLGYNGLLARTRSMGFTWSMAIHCLNQSLYHLINAFDQQFSRRSHIASVCLDD